MQPTREHIKQSIDQFNDEQLDEIAKFINFIQFSSQFQKNKSSEFDSPDTSESHSPIAYRPASGESLENYQGGWAGDDFEECLQQVYESRSKINVDHDGSF